MSYVKRTDDELIKSKDDLIIHINRIFEKSELSETCVVSSNIIQKSKKKIIPTVYLTYTTRVRIEIELRRDDSDDYQWIVGQTSITGKRMDFSGDVHPIGYELEAAEHAIIDFFKLRIMRSR